MRGIGFLNIARQHHKGMIQIETKAMAMRLSNTGFLADKLKKDLEAHGVLA